MRYFYVYSWRLYMAARQRKTRKDITVGSLEKKLGLKQGTIKNPDGRKARKDKKLATLQKEAKKKSGT